MKLTLAIISLLIATSVSGRVIFVGHNEHMRSIKEAVDAARNGGELPRSGKASKRVALSAGTPITNGAPAEN